MPIKLRAFLDFVAPRLKKPHSLYYGWSGPVAIPYGNTDIETALGLTSQASEAAVSLRLGYLISIDGTY
jgi:hypothetical protein